MKIRTIGFKINLMVNILAVITILAIFANYASIGKIQEINSTISDVCMKLEQSQGNLREDFQIVRLYANFCYYKMDMPAGHYSTITNSLEEGINAMETEASLLEELCRNSGDDALLTASEALSGAMLPFENYLRGILSDARAENFDKLPNLIDGLYPYTMQLESILNDLRSAISALTDDTLLHSSRCVSGTHSLDLFVVFICIAAWVILMIVVHRTISRPAKLSGAQLRTIVSGIESGNGDLTARICVRSQDEIGQLGKGINRFMDQLQGIMKKMKHQADTLMDSVREVGLQVADSTENASSVSAVMQELSASMEEISATLGQISAGSSRVMNEVGSMDRRVQDGVSLVSKFKTHAGNMYRSTISSKDSTGRMIENIRAALSAALEESRSVEKINDLTQEILNISGQTNLLSLNASIEAARAGDAGRGFAVVAGEIRTLADDSARTAGNIQNISKLVTGAVNQLAKNAEDILRFIDETVLKDYDDFVGIAQQYEHDTDDVNGLLLEFAANTGEINATIQAINQGISNISIAADESARGVTTAAENVVSLVTSMSQIQAETNNNKKIAEDLEYEVNRFQNL